MDRRQRRQERRARKSIAPPQDNNAENVPPINSDAQIARDNKFTKLLTQNEDDLLNFVATINKLYQEKLGRPAPFMTFVICGMQSAGKSTIMERFMSAPLNIVQEGTGTRCPLDTTCIHDSSLTEPRCELNGKELNPDHTGDNLSTDQVFKAITEHNKALAKEDKFSTESLRLVYRAKNVQNMRFVDTPGIISNKGSGKDNREDIKRILRDTMKKPNSKLCVLVEPKEFSTNPIIDFCDDTFGGRKKWTESAIILMTKFDKQLEDARSGSKANNFFKEFHENSLFPFLVITPTLPREDLPPEELFEQRKDLLETATKSEEERFEDWRLTLEKFREISPDDPQLHPDIKSRIGFSGAKDKMREVMLTDTANRLPEVLSSLRLELAACQEEMERLEEKKKLMDPREIKIMVGDLLHVVANRINAYLDGDLETASKFPETLQDLEQELEEEEESEWCSRKLGSNATLDEEEKWREEIDKLIHDGKIPSHVYPDKGFLGGKQFQRAKAVMKVAMSEAIPDPEKLKEYVASGAGYLQGGLQRENWERATLSIVKMSAKSSSHPGINFFIKHVGSIFRRFFAVALHDIKTSSIVSNKISLLPAGIETHLITKYDDMIWDLMETAANKTHVSLEPMYSSLDPTLPTFHPIEDEDTDVYKMSSSNTYEKVPSKKQKREQGIVEKLKSRFESTLLSLDQSNAKQLIREESERQATEKKNFLPEERTQMINEQETQKIINSAFQYTLALHDQIQIYLNFQINHYLYEGFKDKLSTFSRGVLEDDWSLMVPKDNGLEEKMAETENKISGLKQSLRVVKIMQARF